MAKKGRQLWWVYSNQWKHSTNGWHAIHVVILLKKNIKRLFVKIFQKFLLHLGISLGRGISLPFRVLFQIPVLIADSLPTPLPFPLSPGIRAFSKQFAIHQEHTKRLSCNNSCENYSLTNQLFQYWKGDFNVRSVRMKVKQHISERTKERKWDVSWEQELDFVKNTAVKPFFF